MEYCWQQVLRAGWAMLTNWLWHITDRPFQNSPDYEAYSFLGTGDFSTVWRAANVQTGEVVALKVQTKAAIKDVEGGPEIATELRIHARLTHSPHPFIATLLASFQSPSSYFLVVQVRRKAVIGQRRR